MDYSQISILQIFQHYGLKQIRRGDKVVIACPFHKDENPSCYAYLSSNSWYCFSCNSGGDVYEFIQKKEDINFYKAKQWIEDNFENIEQIKLPSLEIKEKPKQKKSTITQTEILYWHNMLNSEKRQFFYNRGFTDAFINKELFGYDGSNYIIPIWEAQPGNSKCLAVKKRLVNREKGQPKYIKFGGNPQIYNRYYCEYSPVILGFFGELDAARCTQDGYPSFSTIDGQNGWKKLSSNWPNEYFPHTQNLITVSDIGEEIAASLMAQQWENTKGKFTAKVFHWPEFDGTDYCDYRQKHNDFDKLIERYL